MALDRSLLRPYNFSLTFDKVKDMVVFCQEITLPDITLNILEVPIDPTTVKLPGDKLVFGEQLQMTVVMDEELRAYEAVYDWFYEIRDPRENAGRHKDPRDCFSDATLTIRGGNSQRIGDFRFVNCFPVSLGSPVFKTTDTEDTIITVQMGFGYQRFEFYRKGFPPVPGL